MPSVISTEHLFSYRPGESLANFLTYFEFAKPPSDHRITVNNSGYGMLKSQCFLKSKGQLTCTTCHDPHQPASSAKAIVACRSCHSSEHASTETDCVGCHMPKRRTEDAVHVVMTDHSIRRQPLLGDPTAPLRERHDRWAGPIEDLYPRSVQDTPENRLYRAVAQIGVSADLATDIASLQHAIQAARPAAIEPYLAWADALKKAGRHSEALEAYRMAMEKASADARPYVAAAELLAGSGQLTQAVNLLKLAIRKLPEDTTILNALAVLYVSQERYGEALRVSSKAVAINGDDPVSWVNFGVCSEAMKNKKGAEAAYRQAVLLQPDLQRANDLLRRVSEDKF